MIPSDREEICFAIALFPLISNEKKDNAGTESYNPDGLVQRTIKAIKQEIPEITVITDVALDPFSTYGHDGIVEDGKILNDETVEVLVKQAISQIDFFEPETTTILFDIKFCPNY